MRILLSGSRGLIGSSLNYALEKDGHRVIPLVRNAGLPGGVTWDPVRQIIDASALEGLDAAIHLAGEPIMALRWTSAKKQRIRQSRVLGTQFLANTIAGLKHPPPVLLCASAIGYYGDRGTETLMEGSLPGRGFLPEVCVEWEAAARAARERGIRVVHLRFGIILSRVGGAMRAMLPVFRLGLGGPMGNGEQFMSWISLTDAVGAIRFAMSTPGIKGPINVTAPNPVTNREFSRVLAKSVHRPAFMRVPAGIARFFLGEMANALLLASTRALPEKLLQAGFAFRHRELDLALRGTNEARVLTAE